MFTACWSLRAILPQIPTRADNGLSLVIPLACVSFSGEHFIERHRKSLIDRVTAVSPILDELHGDVLQPEQYDTIRSQRTSQEKMRSLYDCVRGWNVACKDKFYAALKKHEQHLVADLEGN